MKFINNNNSHIGAEAAKGLALAEARVNASDASFTLVALRRDAAGVLYELSFVSFWTQFDCYVDACTGEVLGLSSEPTSDMSVAATAVA